MITDKKKYRYFPRFRARFTSSYKGEDVTLYAFVNALRYVGIKGTPFPVRDQKLILNGEDDAFFMEAVKEIGIRTPSLNYETLIREIVIRKWRDEYDMIKDSIPAFYDVEKMSRMINSPVCVYRFSGALWSGSTPDDKISKNIMERRDSVSNQKTAEWDVYYESWDKRFEENKKTKSEIESDRNNRILKAVSKLNDAIDRIGEKKEYSRKSEDKRFDTRLVEIERRHSAGMITDYEYRVLVGKAEDEHLKNREIIDCDYQTAYADAHRVEQAEIAEIMNDCDRRILEIDEEFTAWDESEIKRISELSERLDRSLYTFVTLQLESGESVPTLERMTEWSIAALDFNAQINDAQLTVSCADRYFEKFALFAPSGTPEFALYADMERMRLEKISSGGVFRTSYVATFDHSSSPSSERYFTEIGQGGYGIASALVPTSLGSRGYEVSDTGVWSVGDWDKGDSKVDNRVFVVYYGDRDDFDDNGQCLIDYVLAEVSITQEGGNTDERMQENCDAQNRYQNAVESDPKYDELILKGDIYWNYDGFPTIVGKITDGMKQATKVRNDTMNALKDKSYPRSYEYRKIVKFMPTRIGAEEEIKKIDSLYDDRDEKLEEEQKKLCDRLNDVVLNFVTEIDDAVKERDASYADADLQYEKDMEKAQSEFMKAATSGIEGTNDSIHDEPDVNEKRAILRKYESDVVDPAAVRRIDSELDAAAKRNAKKEEARIKYNDRIKDANQQRADKETAERDRYDTEAERIRNECNEQVDAIYKKVDDAISAARRLPEKERYNALKVIDEIHYDKRMRFEAAVDPQEAVPGYRDDCSAYHAEVHAIFTNVWVHYRDRRCSTGVDYSKWYKAAEEHSKKRV